MYTDTTHDITAWNSYYVVPTCLSLSLSLSLSMCLQTPSTTTMKPGKLDVEVDLAEDPIAWGNIPTILRKNSNIL
jgi:hypothetical protein